MTVLQTNVAALPHETNFSTQVQTSIDPWIFVAEALLFGAIAWVVVGNRYFFEGESMERPVNRIAQLYGYTVCLIAIIIFLVSIRSIAESFITLNNPLSSQYGYGVSLESFEAYKATYDQPNAGYVVQSESATKKPVPSDSELRARYEALRADRISSNLFDARRSLALDGLMLVIAIILFIIHWRWLQTLSRV